MSRFKVFKEKDKFRYRSNYDTPKIAIGNDGNMVINDSPSDILTNESIHILASDQYIRVDSDGNIYKCELSDTLKSEINKEISLGWLLEVTI